MARDPIFDQASLRRIGEARERERLELEALLEALPTLTGTERKDAEERLLRARMWLPPAPNPEDPF